MPFSREDLVYSSCTLTASARMVYVLVNYFPSKIDIRASVLEADAYVSALDESDHGWLDDPDQAQG